MGRKLQNAMALYMEGIQEGRAREAVTKYSGARYTQHSTGVRDGIEGFAAFFEDFFRRNPVRDIRIVRGWEDGQYVFVQAHQVLGDGETQWVTTDFFDTDDDDQIIEHWDVISAFEGTSPSGHTQIDGPKEVVDEHLTEANKAVVRALLEDAWFVDGKGERIEELVHPDCIQHNPEVPDGRDAFAARVREPKRPLVYDEIVLCVGRGNFVATLCRASWEGTPMCQADIFRLEGGLVVEHWDNAEPVPADPVNSGKF